MYRVLNFQYLTNHNRSYFKRVRSSNGRAILSKFRLIFLIALLSITLFLSFYGVPSTLPGHYTSRHARHIFSEEKSGIDKSVLQKPPSEEEDLSKQPQKNRQNLLTTEVKIVTLPATRNVSKELIERLEARGKHLREVCRQEGLDTPSLDYQENAWEFLINKKHHLIYCNVFKAASSTWLKNFNLLAGYTEQEIMKGKTPLIELARKRYPRPTVAELRKAMNANPHPLTFMIARHPLERLVSGYRNKILSGHMYYRRLSQTILNKYKDMGGAMEIKIETRASRVPEKSKQSLVVPSFSQFVQFILDEVRERHKLDEHWMPMNTLCTPCLVHFDVFAKVETMEEDGNYIINLAGIQDIIKLQRINPSETGPVGEVAKDFICQISKTQMDGLLHLYRDDIKLFNYDVSKYVECTRF